MNIEAYKNKAPVILIFLFIFAGYLWSTFSGSYLFPFEPNTQYSQKLEANPLSEYSLVAFSSKGINLGDISISKYFFPYSDDSFWEALCQLSRSGHKLQELLNVLPSLYSQRLPFYSPPFKSTFGSLKYKVTSLNLATWVKMKDNPVYEEATYSFAQNKIVSGPYLNKNENQHCR